MLSVTTFSYTRAPKGQMHLMDKNILQKQFYKGTKAFTIPFKALSILKYGLVWAEVEVCQIKTYVKNHIYFKMDIYIRAPFILH